MKLYEPCKVFNFTKFPRFTRVPIRTKGLPFFRKLSVWMFGKIKIQLTTKFCFTYNGINYEIKRRTVSDGASIPKGLLPAVFAVVLSFRYYFYPPVVLWEWIIAVSTVVLLACWLKLNPLGLMLIPGLVHDNGYEHGYLSTSDRDKRLFSKYELDVIMRDISIQVNEFPVISYIVFGILTLFGWPAWLSYRWKQKREAEKKIKGC